MSILTKDVLFIGVFVLVVLLAYVGIGFFSSALLIMFLTALVGGGLTFAMLMGQPTSYGTYEFRTHHFVALLLVWFCIGLIWLGYYIRHGHWPA